MTMISLKINGKQHNLDIDPDTPLLWVLRETTGLTGTKFSCGISKCGNCMVLVNGKAVTSCELPVSAVANQQITTIEGITSDDHQLHPLQQAWIDEDVSECGYCQPGQIMAAIALLNEIPQPNDSDIDKAMSAVLCRCGTYRRIRQAILRVVGNNVDRNIDKNRESVE